MHYYELINKNNTCKSLKNGKNPGSGSIVEELIKNGTDNYIIN